MQPMKNFMHQLPPSNSKASSTAALPQSKSVWWKVFCLNDTFHSVWEIMYAENEGA